MIELVFGENFIAEMSYNVPDEQPEAEKEKACRVQGDEKYQDRHKGDFQDGLYGMKVKRGPGRRVAGAVMFFVNGKEFGMMHEPVRPVKIRIVYKNQSYTGQNEISGAVLAQIHVKTGITQFLQIDESEEDGCKDKSCVERVFYFFKDSFSFGQALLDFAMHEFSGEKLVENQERQSGSQQVAQVKECAGEEPCLKEAVVI